MICGGKLRFVKTTAGRDSPWRAELRKLDSNIFDNYLTFRQSFM
jgi:hypothetical protein